MADSRLLIGQTVSHYRTLVALKERSTQQYVAPFDIAAIYVGLEAKTSTFEWLEKAYEDHSTWLIYLKVIRALTTFGTTRVTPTCWAV